MTATTLSEPGFRPAFAGTWVPGFPCSLERHRRLIVRLAGATYYGRQLFFLRDRIVMTICLLVFVRRPGAAIA